MDETIRGHVFCSFLALVLRKELDKRLGLQGMDYEWYNIKHDLTAICDANKFMMTFIDLFMNRLQNAIVEDQSNKLHCNGNIQDAKN